MARLGQSGVDEKVVLSYVQKSPPTYALSADQIVCLRDVGVSESVLALRKVATRRGVRAAGAAGPGVDLDVSRSPKDSRAVGYLFELSRLV